MATPPDPDDPGEGPAMTGVLEEDSDSRSESGSDAGTSGSDDDGSSGSSDDDDDESEPMLKYQRLGGAVPSILSDDVASCACAGGNIVVLGTKRGAVIVLDRGGNELRRFADAHGAPVNDVCLDARCEWVGSCAEDGTCVIVPLYDDDDDAHASSASSDIVRCECDAPVRSIALDPKFATRRSRRFVRGGDDGALVLSSIGPPSRSGSTTSSSQGRHDVVLHEGEGPVRRVRWCDALIAWANDSGVKVYDEQRGRRIAYVDRPKGSPPPHKYAPHIAWCDGARTLVVAWADCVKVAKVRTRTLTKSERMGYNTSRVPTLSDPNPGLSGSASALSSSLQNMQIDLDGIKANVGKFGDHLTQQLSGVLAGGSGAGAATSVDSTSGTSGGVRARRMDGVDLAGDEPAAKTTVARFVEVVAMFQTDFWICGIAPSWSPEKLVAFAFADSSGGSSSRPEVRVLTWQNEDLTCDALTMKGYQSFSAGDYHLAACVPTDEDDGVGNEARVNSDAGSNDAAYYLVSPRDVLVGRVRTAADKIRWLVETRGDYEGALETCDAAVASGAMAHDADVFGQSVNRRDEGEESYDESGDESRRSVKDIVADMYIQSHLDTNDPARGASLTPRLLGTDTRAWERWIGRFARGGHLPHLAPYVPADSPRLSNNAYETVLNAFLAHPKDHPQFLATVKAWPPRIYSVPSMVSAVRRRLEHGGEGGSPTLKEALAELYLADGQRERALSMHLELGRPSVLDFVQRHDLLGLCVEKTEGTHEPRDTGRDTLARLARLDPGRASRMLVSSRADSASGIPVDVAVRSLMDAVRLADTRGTRECLHLYLRELFDADQDAGERWHDAQVSLYAEFHPNELLHFLETALGYDVSSALATCTARGLLKERVYLLARIGDVPTALDVIIGGLGDAKFAARFARDHLKSFHDESDLGDDDDETPGKYADELWEGVITRVTECAGSNPHLVGDLMDALGEVDGVDPRRVLRSAPRGIDVSGAGVRLCNILRRSRRAESDAFEARCDAERTLRDIQAKVDAARRRAFHERAVEVED